MEKITITEMTIDEFIASLKVIVKEVLVEQEQKKSNERLLSAEAARKLFTPIISKPTLHRWTKDGRIPAYRLGGRIFYKETEVIEAAKVISKYNQKILND